MTERSDPVLVEVDPDPDNIMRPARIEELEHLRRQRDKTGNPLYVWEAIRHCHHPNYPMPYPDWVRDYLFEVAVDLNALGRLLDPWTCPERRPDESKAEHLKRFQLWQTQTIPAAKAAALTAKALRFLRKGWNACQRFHADAAARGYALDFEFPADGSRRRVLEDIVKSQNLEEERSARRRISRGQELLERRPPPRQRSKPPP